MLVKVEMEVEIPDIKPRPSDKEIIEFIEFEVGYSGFLPRQNPFNTMAGKTKSGQNYKFDVQECDVEILEDDENLNPQQ